MSYETFQLNPVTPVIGAEIEGLDLQHPLSDPQRKELHHALLNHHVLFFREQDLDFEQHKPCYEGPQPATRLNDKEK